MDEMTLLLHGWSDCSDSFRKMKEFLIRNGVGNVRTILYADYESREDSITFNDIVDGLNDQLMAHRIIDEKGRKLRQLNVIVHSTGGLVIRHWIWRYYYRDRDRLKDCPVQRLVMLAPANFGSPLAHRGKSLLGGLVKGRWKVGDLWEVGRQVLDGLELASPYQWELAHRDLFLPRPYYNAHQIQTTILVGAQDYEGLRGWVNRPGTDGTVVIAGTSIDSAKLVLDFSAQGAPAEWTVTNPPDEFAFGVLEGLDHGSIVDQVAPGADNIVGELVLRALSTKSSRDFTEFQKRVDSITSATYASTGTAKFQQFLLHAVDDQGDSIPDFTVEFYLYKATKKDPRGVIARESLSAGEGQFSDQAHALLAREFHAHSKDPSYRRLLVNVGEVKALLAQARQALGGEVVLSMRLYVPAIDNGIQYENEELQNIILFETGGKDTKLPKFFYDNTTTLIELRVNRFTSYVVVGPEARKH